MEYGPRAFKGPDLPGSLLFRAEDPFFFFFFACRSPPPHGADAGFTKRRGGGGAAPNIGPRALEDPRYATGASCQSDRPTSVGRGLVGLLAVGPESVLTTLSGRPTHRAKNKTLFLALWAYPPTAVRRPML